MASGKELLGYATGVKMVLPRIKEFHDEVFLEVYLETCNEAAHPRSLKGIDVFQTTSSLLDVGCGDGYFAHLLAQQYPVMQVRGIDYDGKAIDLAVQRGMLSNLRFDNLDVQDLDSSYGSFDYVRLNGSLHHFDDLDNAITNIASVTETEGILVISDFDRDWGLRQTTVKDWYEAREQWGQDYVQMFAADNIFLNGEQVRLIDVILLDSIIASFSEDEVYESLKANSFSIEEGYLTRVDCGAIMFRIFARKNSLHKKSL